MGAFKTIDVLMKEGLTYEEAVKKVARTFAERDYTKAFKDGVRQ